MKLQNVIQRLVRWWKTSRCIRCGGSGGVVFKNKHNHVFVYDCEKCMGSGRVDRLSERMLEREAREIEAAAADERSTT
jgi:DnaJ-class molecular chaperone